MAITSIVYKNFRQSVGTSYATAYTCPAGTTAMVLLCQSANVDGSVSADVSAQWLDSSASNVATRIGHTVTVPPKAALGMLDGKLVLEAGDVLQVMASSTGKIEISGSVQEMS